MKLPDSHGFVTAGLFALTVLVFVLAAFFPDLRHDDLFKTLAQAIVITGLINMAVGFYFGASKAAQLAAPPAPAPSSPPADGAGE